MLAAARIGALALCARSVRWSNCVQTNAPKAIASTQVQLLSSSTRFSLLALPGLTDVWPTKAASGIARALWVCVGRKWPTQGSIYTNQASRTA